MSKNVGKLAGRYARALLAAANKDLGTSGSPTPAQELAISLLGFSKVWQEDVQLASAINNPMFDKNERLKALIEVAKRAGLSDVAQRFLQICFERDRISAFPEIADAFARAADEAAGLIHVEIVTAREVQASEAKTIEQGLATKLSGKARFQWRVDPEILGGMVIRYAGKVLDGSLSGKLQRIERRLMAS